MATIIVIENSEPRHYELCDQVLCPGTQFPRALVPGLNQVDADAWAAVKNVPAVAGLIAAGVLREVPAAAPPAPTAPGLPGPGMPPAFTMPGPKDLPAAGAIAMVRSTRDPATPEAWRAGETRVTVLAAIEAQLASLGG